MVAECMQVSSLQAMNRQDFECGSTRLQLCNCASLIGRYACTIADEAITGEPLSDFGRLQETVGLLASTDHRISPYHHRAQLLRNLPTEYDMIRTVIEDKTPQPTIQHIMGALKRTEKELDIRKKATSTNTSATSELAL